MTFKVSIFSGTVKARPLKFFMIVISAELYTLDRTSFSDHPFLRLEESIKKCLQ